MLFPVGVFTWTRNTALRSFRGVNVVISTALLSASVYAADFPLTLAAAQRLAVERSRQLAAQDDAISASRDMAVAAGQLPDPVLKAGIDNLPINGPDRFSLGRDFMTMRRIGLEQEITRSDKRQLRSERFELEAQKTLAQKTVTTAAIERDTALAWLDLYYAQAMLVIIAEQGTQAKFEIQAAEGAYRAGRGSQTEIVVARSALAMFDDRTSEMQRRVRNAKTMLARWIGTMAELPLADKPATDQVRLDPASLDTQLIHHPEIAVLSRQEEIAANDAKLANANKKADWNVEIAYQQRGPAYSNMLSIGVSVPLQWNQKNRQDRELTAKLTMFEQAKSEREDMLRAHIAETRAMFNEWDNDRERIVRYQNELIPLAGERVLTLMTAYRGGKATLAELLMARRNDIDVRLQALQLRAESDRLWAQLNFLIPIDGANAHMAVDTKKDKS